MPGNRRAARRLGALDTANWEFVRFMVVLGVELQTFVLGLRRRASRRSISNKAAARVFGRDREAVRHGRRKRAHPARRTRRPRDAAAQEARDAVRVARV